MLVRPSWDSVTAGGRKSGCASPRSPWHAHGPLLLSVTQFNLPGKSLLRAAQSWTVWCWDSWGKKGTRKCRHCVKILPHLYVVHIGCVAAGSLTLIGQSHTQNGWIQTYTLWTLAIQTMMCLCCFNLAKVNLPEPPSFLKHELISSREKFKETLALDVKPVLHHRPVWMFLITGW